jgi:YVTN family beta-propeller protein
MRTLGLVLVLAQASGARPEPDRSPIDLAISPDGRWVLTANRTSDTASLVDLEAGRAVAEIPVGSRPCAVVWRGTRAAIANERGGSVTLLEVQPPRLSFQGAVQVGREPRALAFSPEGDRLYVALSGEDRVAALDAAGGRALSAAEVGDDPRRLALTTDGRRLVVACGLSQDVDVLDAATLAPLFRVDLGGRNPGPIVVSPDGAWAYVAHVADRGGPTTTSSIEQGRVLANRLARISLAGPAPREAIAADAFGFGAADLEGAAIDPDGTRIVLSSGGTRSILVFAFPIPFSENLKDHLDPALRKDPSRFRRIAGLRGRPVGLRFLPDGRRIAVANYLRNEVQIVDLEQGEVVRSVFLGGPAEPSLARRGEAIFYDAFRSWHEWFSCHTCHPDGHTNGGLYDTFNDGAYGNPKKVLSLRGVVRTGPWTWHGRQEELPRSLQGSFTRTMGREAASAEDLRAMIAFLETLDFPPPAGPPTDAARRGEALFRDRACDTCHAPPDYTSPETYLVGLEDPHDAYKGFNPPPLRGVGTRGPYLHDGRARTLEEVLQKHHRPSRLNGRPDFTPEELADLLAFLRSL